MVDGLLIACLPSLVEEVELSFLHLDLIVELLAFELVIDHGLLIRRDPDEVLARINRIRLLNRLIGCDLADLDLLGRWISLLGAQIMMIRS